MLKYHVSLTLHGSNIHRIFWHHSTIIAFHFKVLWVLIEFWSSPNLSRLVWTCPIKYLQHCFLQRNNSWSQFGKIFWHHRQYLPFHFIIWGFLGKFWGNSGDFWEILGEFWGILENQSETTSSEVNRQIF